MAGVIHDLAAYYDLLASDPSSGMAPLGWTREKAGVEVLLSGDGVPVSVAALATGGRHFMTVAPAHSRRGGSVVIGFPLCDNPTYTFGTVGDGGDVAHARACHLSYLTEAHAAFDNVDDDGARAFLAFLDSGVLPEPAEGDAEAARALAHGTNVTFRLEGDSLPIHMRPAVREAWDAYFAYRHPGDPDAPCGQDSTTGVTGPLARLFPSVTGIRGAQSSGASLARVVQLQCGGVLRALPGLQREPHGGHRPQGERGPALPCLLALPQRRPWRREDGALLVGLD
jgi:CRISPR-associated protein Csd1